MTRDFTLMHPPQAAAAGAASGFHLRASQMMNSVQGISMAAKKM